MQAKIQFVIANQLIKTVCRYENVVYICKYVGLVDRNVAIKAIK